MTRLSLVLATTTAMCSPAIAMDDEGGDTTASQTPPTMAGVAEKMTTEASEAYEAITREASEAAEAVENAAQSAMSTTDAAIDTAAGKTEQAYESTVESVENTVETLAAKAEMGEALALTPIDLDNRADFLRASDIIGAQIYTAQAAIEPGAWQQSASMPRISAEWESIGTIAEMVVGPEGNLRGLIAEVGGFLGIGDAHVMIEMADLHRTLPDDDGEFSFVTWMSQEELKNERPVEKDWWQ